MPTIVDFVFVLVLVVVASILEHFVFWPRFRAEVASGDARARVRAYARAIVGQWAFAVVALVIWFRADRPLSALRLDTPSGWRLWLGIVLVAAMIGLLRFQLRSVFAISAEQRVALRPKLAELAFLLPHTRRDHRWFLTLSVTAGICEELLYRGYLTWVLTPWLGYLGAMLGATLLFGLGHAYQGRKGAMRATLAGAVMAAIVLATGWLVPAMIVHAMVDAGSGTVGHLLLRDGE